MAGAVVAQSGAGSPFGGSTPASPVHSYRPEVGPLSPSAGGGDCDSALRGSLAIPPALALELASAKRRPFALASCKLGFRMCGCAEAVACVHKDAETGRPLPSYETAYVEWRKRTDWKALFASLAWLVGRSAGKENATLRKLAAVAVQARRSEQTQPRDLVHVFGSRVSL